MEGRLVSSRWWFRTVRNVGQPALVHDGTRVFPVEFTDGTYGVVRETERRRNNGRVQLQLKEIRPHDSDCLETLRKASGMPSIISVGTESCRIAVAHGPDDLIIVMRMPGARIYVSEMVMAAP